MTKNNIALLVSADFETSRINDLDKSQTHRSTNCSIINDKRNNLLTIEWVFLFQHLFKLHKINRVVIVFETRVTAYK